MCASRGLEYACSERCALVRIPNSDVLPTCGRPMMPVFMIRSQVLVLSSQSKIKHIRVNHSVGASAVYLRVGARARLKTWRLASHSDGFDTWPWRSPARSVRHTLEVKSDFGSNLARLCRAG